MTGAVKAADIAPEAYGDEGTMVKKANDLTYDIGNLAAFDTHPFTERTQIPGEKKLLKVARDNMQLLINKIFDLPKTSSDGGLLAQLPAPEMVIPREKPLPTAKPETRWEKFAREKGILKRKKGRMAWDEQKEEWAPRWGYKRANDNLDDWAVEVKPGKDPNADPWTERKQAKKERVAKNSRQKTNNETQGASDGKNALPTGIPVELAQVSNPKAKQRGRKGTRKTLKVVQESTASMGEFDKARKGEPERKKPGRRNHFDSVTVSAEIEKGRSMSILDRVLGKEQSQGKAASPVDDVQHETRKKGRGMKRKMKKVTRGQANKKGRRK